MNVFLNELADELTDDDLKKMKYFLTGLNGTRKGVLEQIKDPLDLFQHLRQRCLLTHDNIVVLQAMLWHTKRKDLHNRFIKFARKRSNIVHFFPATEKPENGFEYIKFHIGGKEKMDRHKLEKLRLLVSQVLCIPLEFAIAAGIEATNSILVTFMVPVGYANIILDLNDEDRGYLGSEGVDAVWCDGQTINCSEFISSIQDESMKHYEEVKLLMDQKCKLETELENLQIEGLKLYGMLRQSEEKQNTLQHEYETRISAITFKLIQEYSGMKYTSDALSQQSLDLKNSLRWFNHIMKKLESLNYDTELIRELLEANSTVTRLNIRSIHDWIASQQNLRINMLQEEKELLRYERSKLAYFLKVGISAPVLTENEQFFVHTMSAIPLPSFTQTTEVTFSLGKMDTNGEALTQVLAEVFKAFEDTLNPTEMETLMNKYLSSEENKKNYRESNLRLLEYLWLDYAKRNGNENANFQKWMVILLASIKRFDLYDSWAQKGDLLIKAYLADTATDDENTNAGGRGQHAASFTPMSKDDKRSGNDLKGRKAKRQQQRLKSPLESKNDVSTIDERLQRMEKLLEKALFSKSLEEKTFLDRASEKCQYDFSKILQSKTDEVNSFRA